MARHYHLIIKGRSSEHMGPRVSKAGRVALGLARQLGCRGECTVGH